MRFAALYAVIIGVMMIGQWTFFIITGNVPEFQTEPYRIAFHLAAELLTALALIAGGVGLLKKTKWAKPAYLVATGMLFYTAVVSPGYFAQQGVWALVAMFGVVLVLAGVSLWVVLKKSDGA